MFNLGIASTSVHPFGDSTELHCGIFNAASCLRVSSLFFAVYVTPWKTKLPGHADERRKSKVRWRINEVAKIPATR